MEIYCISTMIDNSFIKSQILAYIGYKKKIEETNSFVFYKQSNKVKGGYRYTIEIPPGLYDNFEGENQLKSTHITSKSVASATLPNDSFSLSDVFRSIFDSNKSTGHVRVQKNKEEISLALLKTFWFECCVTFQIFYNMLLAPIKSKEWIDLVDFVKSIEATFQKNICKAFLSEKDAQKISSGIRTQQLLFFFCVVEWEYGEIDLSGLIKVLRLSQRTNKNKDSEILRMASNFLTIADNRRKEVRPVITFKEFISVLLNKL